MQISDIDLRQAVLDNITNSSISDLRETILDAIKSGEDKTLPGLGVLFEVIWNHSAPQAQGEMLQTLHHEVQQKEIT